MITIWQHGADEEAGEVEAYFTRIKEQFEILRLYETDRIPSPPPSHLIILGGQMSVNNTQEYPFFYDEQKIIREMLEMGRPVLGICLGAQMIAAARGEQVFPSTEERGWNRITGCNPEWQAIFPEDFVVFHWHNETFNFPAEATLLSRGDLVKNQAFKIGSAVGVQFHPEVTQPIISQWSETRPSDERTVILRETERYLYKSRKRCHGLLDAFLKGWV